ncbi:protein phosphatase 1 regulatory subunit 1B-like isoform X2 [Sinocyclocheilus rhinocerous]|uniref:protein phosphatase 1 regulatory subunit 1B-like isoform X2 n=1 Tax=Sinocyclocheilus rhinocerous TaxID=307959 RepID=UPI0007BA3495|nr:PREDICTED: protein phosphatase 1 regulatory subunit 1B-like isoform X2 [Sinocyclocheilus rhinocerous]
MDPSNPSNPSEGPVEPKERRKIQFAVPPTEPTQLDPRQVEMIRRRRPTPATLFKVADQTSPEDDISTHQWVVGENGVLKPKRINPNIYQPPSLKAVQQMAEAHMQKLDSQEQRDMAEHQPGMRKAGATAPTDEEEEEEVEADNMAEDECRNVD